MEKEIRELTNLATKENISDNELEALKELIKFIKFSQFLSGVYFASCLVIIAITILLIIKWNIS